jgi:hypothetical protein
MNRQSGPAAVSVCVVARASPQVRLQKNIGEAFLDTFGLLADR